VDESAEKRTDLAVERTMLAWWRTGLAALAVALAVGRLLPELSDVETTWPYVALGLGFAVYATAIFAYGGWRGAGGSGGRPPAPVMAMAVGGGLLALTTIALIAAG